MFMTQHIMQQARHKESVDGRIPLPWLQVTQEELGRAVKCLSRERRMRGGVPGLEHWWEQGNTGIKDTDSGTELAPI